MAICSSVERVKMAPELVVFLFLWVLCRWQTELARRVVLRSKKTKILLLSADITDIKALTCSKDRACARGAIKLFLYLLVAPDLQEKQNFTVFPQSKHFNKAHVARKWACK